MPILSKVQKGQPITAELFNSLIDTIRECQINAVVGSGGTSATFKRGPGGTTISIDSRNTQQTATTASAQTCPFDPVVTVTGNSFDVSFRIGTINGAIPSNMLSTINVPTSSPHYFYLKCTTDGKVITTAEIESDTTPRQPQQATQDAAPTLFNILIAFVTTAGVATRTLPCGNIQARIVPSIQEDSPAYVAGERNYTQWYNWYF